jgi:hypothetical protein
VLEKDTYDMVDYNGIPLGEPRNGLYLKKYTMLKVFFMSDLYFNVSYSSVCFFVSFSALKLLIFPCAWFSDVNVLATLYWLCQWC